MWDLTGDRADRKALEPCARKLHDWLRNLDRIGLELARDLDDSRKALARLDRHRPQLVVIVRFDVGEDQPANAGLLGDARSEERRVGKEGRSRWSPYH